MDDVDLIVLSSLKEIGFEVKSEIVNLKLCPFDDMVEMTIYCLNTIKPDCKFPSHLPPTMSAKYNMCAQLANVCKELGYKGDIGYHTFLYTNPTDIRNILIFLVQHLPRQVTFEETEKSENKNSVTIRQKTVEELRKALTSKTDEHYGMCQTPFISASLETGTLLPNQKIDCKPLEWRNFVIEKLPFIDEQLTDYQYLLPSLISLNSNGVLNPKKPKCSTFSLKPLEESFFNSAPSRGSSDNAQNNNLSQLPSELPGLRGDDSVTNDSFNESFQSESGFSEAEKEAERINLENQIRNMKENISTLNLKLNKILESNNKLQKSLEEKNVLESTLQQSLLLLPDSENNIPKLLAANEKCRNKMKNLETQWERHKELLTSRRAELKNALSSKINERNELIQNVMELRKELFSVAEQIEQRNIIEQKLTESNELKGVQRNEYVQRILEIIKNIKKQGIQIEKILGDMRYVQREINTLSGKINRSFALAEQMIVTNSKNDEFSLETHKLLLKLHKDVSDILTMTGETGNYSRDTKDLEEQLQSLESSENMSASLNQVRNDLKRILEEKALLLKEIRVLEDKKKASQQPPAKEDHYGKGDMDDEEFRRIIIEDFGYDYFAELEAIEAVENEVAEREAAANKASTTT